MIILKNLSKIYEGHLIPVLNNIDLEVSAGEIFGIIGKSGAGKSTLIRCANLLERPTSGQVIVDGVELTALNAKALRVERRQLGMIFQHFNLLESRTAFENIALPLELSRQPKAIIAKRVNELLSLVGLEDRANYYPSNLSGGQKQRVAIARALATHSKILLCDEPTSALDPESTQSILKLLTSLRDELDITILLITHEMDVIKTICDRVGILDKGELVEQGSVVDIFTEPKSDITKSLTQKALHLELPLCLKQAIKAEYFSGSSPIVRLAFIGKTANEPIVTALHQRFEVTANILQADLELIHGAMMGFMLCKLMGAQEAIQQALDYLKSMNIKVEIMGYE